MDKFQQILLVAPVLLFSIVAHEYAHGYAAFRQGDRTAHDLGQLTWNPRPYIDPIGTILVPLLTTLNGMPFGWARSAPIDMRNFRNLRRGDIIVSLAGVAANFSVAVAAAVLIIAAGLVGRNLPAAYLPMSVLQAMLQFAVIFNLVLVVINLLPIPPSDGSRVFYHLLPPRAAAAYRRVGAFGFLAIFLLLWFPPAQRALFAPVAGANRLVLSLVSPYILAGP